MEVLHGAIQPYAWGSRSVIAGLQGRPVPSEGPEAELWIGAHPSAPSTVLRDGTSARLDRLIVADPVGMLGPVVAAEFGPRLPYLLKLLAVAAPLSLQAHPDADHARRAYEAERAAGVVEGNYADPYHKPELLVAVTPFEALCGFRDPRMSADVIAALNLAVLEPVVAALRTGAAGLRDAVRTLLTWPGADRAALVEAVTAAPSCPVLARRLAKHHPADPGVLVALLLNHFTLAPGEAVWMPAGNLHAYLDGAGVEIMAASDNVLRGGLTPKRVDVAELLRVLRFEVLHDPVVHLRRPAPGVVTWPVPIRDFALHRVRLDAAVRRVELAVDGPRAVLGLRGEVCLDDGRGAVTVAPGRAAFAPAGGVLALAGAGEAYVASVGQ